MEGGTATLSDAHLLADSRTTRGGLQQATGHTTSNPASGMARSNPGSSLEPRQGETAGADPPSQAIPPPLPPREATAATGEAADVIPATPNGAGSPTALAPQAPPVQPSGGPAAAASEFLGPAAQVEESPESGWQGGFWVDLARDLPAWLVSMILHLLALLLLGIGVHRLPDDKPSITLSTSISDEDAPGEVGELEKLLPETIQLTDLETMGLEDFADIEAPGLGEEDDLTAPVLGMLGLLPDPSMPALRGAMFAGRDPRLRKQLVRDQGGTTATEAAVARGLEWMARHQNADGSWSLHAFHKAPGARGKPDGLGRQSDLAGTALGLLPFLGAGQTHYQGDHQSVVRSGLSWLIDHQAANGDLRQPNDFGRMYAHGMGAIVLCEAYAMTGDPRLRVPAQKAIDFIVDAQHSEGGWRYSPGQAGDTSVVGWQLMALQSARMHYQLNVPQETLDRAGLFLDQVQTDRYGGQYAYRPGRRATEVMSAEALLCRLYLGWKTDHPGVDVGVGYLLDHLPEIRNPNVYYWYYGTQVLHHVGGPRWRKWNYRMRSILLETQERRGPDAGSWAPRGTWSSEGGRIYMTSLAICILEVYYRHMPLHRPEAVEAVGQARHP